MVIEHSDFLPVKKSKWIRCFSSGCNNHEKNIQFYFTEWELQTGASINCVYCEECIIKALPHLLRGKK